MSYENLKTRRVEPVILTDFTYDTTVTSIDTLDSAPDKYATVDEISVEENVLNISTGKPSDIIFNFQNLTKVTTDPDIGTPAENISVNYDNYIYGDKSISFDKVSGLALTNILIDVSDKGWTINQFLYNNVITLYVYLSASDCSKLSENSASKGVQLSLINSTFEYTLGSLTYKFTEGWNKIVMDTLVDTATSVGSESAAVSFNGPLNTIRIDFRTNNATDTLTGVLLGKIEKSNGICCDLLESIEEFADRSVWNDPHGNLPKTSGLTRHGLYSIKLPKRDVTRDYTYMYKLGMSVNWTRFDILRIDYFVEDSDFSKIKYNAMTLKTDDCQYVWRFSPWKAGWNTTYINMRMPSKIVSEIEHAGIDSSQYIDFATYTFNNTDELIGCTFDFLGMTDDLEARLNRSDWIDMLTSANLLNEPDLMKI